MQNADKEAYCHVGLRKSVSGAARNFGLSRKRLMWVAVDFVHAVVLRSMGIVLSVPIVVRGGEIKHGESILRLTETRHVPIAGLFRQTFITWMAI